jgi:hypothetical protein
MTDSDNLASLNAPEARTRHDFATVAGTLGLATLILIAMLGVVIICAAMHGATTAVRP